MPEGITVTRNDARRRYEVHLDGEIGGFLLIRPTDDGRTRLPHTELDPAYKGRGLGSALASEALADLARRGEVVIPECPFIAQYLRRHEIDGLEVAWPTDERGEG